MAAFPMLKLGRLRITVFEACSTFTRVTVCVLAESSKMTLYIEGSSRFVTSTTAPIATGRSESCRVGLYPLKDRAFARRTSMAC